MPRWGMVIDLGLCVGCDACTMACKAENGTPPGIWYAPVYEKEVGRYPDVKRMFIPTLCNHCEDAPCLNACPTGAIFKREDGIVMVNEEVCCGSQACVAACPYGAMHFLETEESEFGGELTPLEKMNFAQWETGTVQKCTFCAPPDRSRSVRTRLRGDLPRQVPVLRRPRRSPKRSLSTGPEQKRPATARGVRHQTFRLLRAVNSLQEIEL